MIVRCHELALDAEIDPGEMTRLRNDVAKRSGLRVRDVEALLNDVIGASAKQYPPGRDVEGLSASTAVVVVGNTHAFTADTANPDEGNAQ